MSSYPPVRDDLVRLLSQPRLAPYKKAVGGKLTPALELYRWNLEISAALFESMHYFEIALRNHMSEALEKWAQSLGATDPWYRDPLVPLSAPTRKKITWAIKQATDDGAIPEVYGRVIAELSFGFWWSLLGDNYNRTLWQPCLQHAFPRAQRRKLHKTVDDLRELRNRIAHHEPIHARDLTADFVMLLRASEQVSSHLAWWIDSTTRVPGVLGRRPRP